MKLEFYLKGKSNPFTSDEKYPKCLLPVCHCGRCTDADHGVARSSKERLRTLRKTVEYFAYRFKQEGGASGETIAELTEAAAVLQALEAHKPDQSMRCNVHRGVNEMSRLLPVYVCHKQVSAAKITRIITAGRLDGKGPGQTLHFDVTDPISKDDTWMSKHEPEVGGYYVVYKGGYASFSPAAAFEEGYKLKEGYVANER